MGNQDKDRLDELKQYTIPTREYWWFTGPELAVSKRFFKYWTAFIGLFVFVSTTILWLTNWWQLALTSAATTLFVGKLWFLGWGTILISMPVGYIFYRRRKSRLIRELKDRRYKLRINKLLDTEGVNLNDDEEP